MESLLTCPGGNKDTVVDPETLFVWRDCCRNIDNNKFDVTEKEPEDKVRFHVSLL